MTASPPRSAQPIGRLGPAAASAAGLRVAAGAEEAWRCRGFGAGLGVRGGRSAAAERRPAALPAGWMSPLVPAWLFGFLLKTFLRFFIGGQRVKVRKSSLFRRLGVSPPPEPLWSAALPFCPMLLSDSIPAGFNAAHIAGLTALHSSSCSQAVPSTSHHSLSQGLPAADKLRPMLR